MNYYRGQDPTQYKISNMNSQGFVVTMMDQNSGLVNLDGSKCAIANYTSTSYSVWVQSDDEAIIG